MLLERENMTELAEKKMRGRKTLLNKEMIQKAGAMLAEGASDRAAHDMLGIDSATWYRWIEKGEARSGSIYSEFSDMIKKARSKLQYDCVHLIKESAKREWQAAAWLLERRYPEEYGKRDRLDMNVTSVQIIDNIPVTSDTE